MRLGCQSANSTNEAWLQQKYQRVIIFFSTTLIGIHSLCAAGSGRGCNATPAVAAKQEDREEQAESKGFLSHIVHTVSQTCFVLHDAGSRLDD